MIYRDEGLSLALQILELRQKNDVCVFCAKTVYVRWCIARTN